MTRRWLVPVLLAVALVACSDDADPQESSSTSSEESRSDTSSNPTTPRSDAAEMDPPDGAVDLTADAVVPGPGDEDASGWALLTLVPERSEVCFELAVDELDGATAAHIHRGPAGESGDVVLGLAPPGEDGTIDSCAAGNQVLLEEMGASPSDFYVQVHTKDFPDGALRAQLR